MKISETRKDKMMFTKIQEKYLNAPAQVRASFWFLICAFLQRGISSITTPIFTRLMTTAEYGQFSVFNSWLGILTIIVTLNLSLGVCGQGLVKFENERDIFASSLQGLSLTLTVLWTVIYLLFHNFWNQLFSLTTVQMLAMFVMMWASAVFNFWSAEQRVKLSYKRLIAITIFVTVAKPVVGIIMVVCARDKVTARILGLALVEFLAYIWLFFAQVKRGKRFFVGKYWKYALVFNIPLIPHYLSQTVLNSADRIMISTMVGEAEAGIYSVAYSIAQFMTLFNTALLQTVGPWMYQKIKDERAEDIPKVTYPIIIAVAAINLLLIAFAPEIMFVFAPPEYHNAIYVIPPIAMSVVFMFSYELFARFEFYYEKTGYIAAATVGGAVLNVLLNYIFIKIFGYYAAGYTTLACYMIYSACHYIAMRKICNKEMGGKTVYNLKKLLAIATVFMVSGFVLLATYRFPLVRYGLIIAFVVLMVIKRKWILDLVKQLISVRNVKGKELDK